MALFEMNYEWAAKLAFEKLCDRLPPEAIEEFKAFVQKGIALQKQLDRIEYVQIEILKILQAQNAISIGTSAVARNIEPPAATGK